MADRKTSLGWTVYAMTVCRSCLDNRNLDVWPKQWHGAAWDVASW